MILNSELQILHAFSSFCGQSVWLLERPQFWGLALCLLAQEVVKALEAQLEAWWPKKKRLGSTVDRSGHRGQQSASLK